MLDVTIQQQTDGQFLYYQAYMKNHHQIGRMSLVLPRWYSMIDWTIPYCNGLMIVHDYRGRGIGSFFVSEIQKQFQMPIGLLCNDMRVAFYARLGFKKVDEINQYNQMEWYP